MHCGSSQKFQLKVLIGSSRISKFGGQGVNFKDTILVKLKSSILTVFNPTVFRVFQKLDFIFDFLLNLIL